MAIMEFNQEFKGYWREINKNNLPKKSGVYFVYECTNNLDQTLSIHRLIYIGESDDVNKRIANHKKRECWIKYVKKGNELCFSFTAVEPIYRERVEAAYIYEHQPPVNIEYKNNFPFDYTHIISTPNNKIAFIKDNFIVERKD